MKRTIALLLCTLLVLSLCACGSTVTVTGSGEEAPAETVSISLNDLKTLGDAIAVGKDSQYISTWDESHYIYCFLLNKTPVRVIAEYDADTYAKVDEIIFSGDPDAEDQLFELLSPLPLSTVEDLSDSMLSDKELSKLSGKTGKDLLEAGWVANGSYWSEDDALVVLMDYDIISYQVKFDSDVERDDDFDVETGIEKLKVDSIELFGLGDACTDVDFSE